MTLLICTAAAVAVTLVWYLSERARKLHIGTLALMFWGASLMWLVDAVIEFLEMGADYFQPAVEDMRNDAFLGAAVVALGLVIWLVIVMVRDPLGTVRAAVSHRS